jgi:acetyl esterase/lipase
LARDSEKLIELAQAARVEVEYKRFEGCFHAFAPVGRNASEAAELLDLSIAFMLKHLHDQKLDYMEAE